LKTSYVDVERKDLRGEGMLGGEMFGAPDASLPRSIGHGAIMGLCVEFVQPGSLEFHP
jgi:hypothetical protein